MKTPNRPTSDCREYLYDHPPSTGSYRAASLIEPLDMNRPPNSEQLEPVYDEIRYREETEQSYERMYQIPRPTNIYINTFGRTKF
ncbi:hypothetical protein JTB14_026278 [Gonioctena quinquepunctata]|nr:hypothetical protein JTB14_026278 [Gonioctena quinquepunctata]